MAKSLRSFIEVAPGSHFPLQNLPYGIFRPDDDPARAGVAIGDLVLDLAVLEESGYFRALELRPNARSSAGDSLNAFFALAGRPGAKHARCCNTSSPPRPPTLRDDARVAGPRFSSQGGGDDAPCRRGLAITPISILPITTPSTSARCFAGRRTRSCQIGNGSRSPITAAPARSSRAGPRCAGRMARSSRPTLRRRSSARARALDFELETAFFVGPPNELGEPGANRAGDRSYFRTGPDERLERARHPDLGIPAARPVPGEEFLHQHFALGRDAGSARAFSQTAAGAGSARRSTYLRAPDDFTFDIRLEAQLQTAKMSAPQTITRTNFQNLYWSMSQQLAHHTVGGCNLQSGDLLASGTISGPAEDGRGSMLELTWRGAEPIAIARRRDAQVARGRRSPNDHRLGAKATATGSASAR